MGKKGHSPSPETRKKMNEGRRKAQSAIGENNPRARHYGITWYDDGQEKNASLNHYMSWAIANGHCCQRQSETCIMGMIILYTKTSSR